MLKLFVFIFVAFFVVGMVVGNPSVCTDGECQPDGSECESSSSCLPGVQCCCCSSSYCSNALGFLGQQSCYQCPDGDDLCGLVGCSTGVCFIYEGDSGNILNDPHFLGLNGHKYDFQGEPNKVFALISEPHVQVNARFRHGSKGSTVMGDICVRFCDSTVKFDSKGSVDVSGPSSSNLIVNRRSNTSAEVNVGLWSLTVERDTKHHPFFNLRNIKLQHPIFAGPMHGVLGVTAPDRTHRPRNGTLTTAPTPHPHCQAKNEGGCEVPGEWHEYEVKNNDLCGTDFKYSQFDSKKCSSIAANLKRGVAEVNLLQQAQQSIRP